MYTIDLTPADKSDEVLSVNPDHIVSFYERKGETVITLTCLEGTMNLKETPAEIKKLIEDEGVKSREEMIWQAALAYASNGYLPKAARELGEELADECI